LTVKVSFELELIENIRVNQCRLEAPTFGHPWLIASVISNKVRNLTRFPDRFRNDRRCLTLDLKNFEGKFVDKS